MRIMYDSVTASDIPAGAKMVAGYINGTFQWSAADWARFPSAVKVRIATRAYVNDGHVLDVEQGDATPAEAPGWVKMRRAAGIDPTVYCGAASLAAVRAAFTSAGVAQPHYFIAHYDNVPTLPAGCVAKQYIDPPTSGGHYDLSVVADYWPGIDNLPEDIVTPDDINKIAAAVAAPTADAVWNKALQNALDGGWSSASDLVRFGHYEAGSAHRALASDRDAVLSAIAKVGVAPVDLDALAAKVAALAPQVDYDKLAKAVNDDAARRLAS